MTSRARARERWYIEPQCPSWGQIHHGVMKRKEKKTPPPLPAPPDQANQVFPGIPFPTMNLVFVETHRFSRFFYISLLISHTAPHFSFI